MGVATALGVTAVVGFGLGFAVRGEVRDLLVTGALAYGTYYAVTHVRA